MKVTLNILLILISLSSTAQSKSECDSLLKKKITSSVSQAEIMSDLKKLVHCENIDTLDTYLIQNSMPVNIGVFNVTYQQILDNYLEFKASDMYVHYKEKRDLFYQLMKTILTEDNVDDVVSMMIECKLDFADQAADYANKYLVTESSEIPFPIFFTDFYNHQDSIKKAERAKREKEELENSMPYALCSVASFTNYLYYPHGLKGYFDLEEGLACAKATNKPCLVIFTGHGCVNCREMEAYVYSDPEILKLLKNEYVLISLYTDDKMKLPLEKQIKLGEDQRVIDRMGKKNAYLQKEMFHENTQPSHHILNAKGDRIAGPYPYDLAVEKFKDFLENGLQQFKKQQK